MIIKCKQINKYIEDKYLSNNKTENIYSLDKSTCAIYKNHYRKLKEVNFELYGRFYMIMDYCNHYYSKELKIDFKDTSVKTPIKNHEELSLNVALAWARLSYSLNTSNKDLPYIWLKMYIEEYRPVIYEKLAAL